jgi:hypothetical protein
MPASHNITINFDSYKIDPSDTTWALPAWGHPASLGILPLFVTVDNCLIPIGTACSTGRGIKFIVSAEHNIRESLKYEVTLKHLLFEQKLPENIQLKDVGLSVLIQHVSENDQVHVSIVPLENIDGGPPTDIVFGYPKFMEGLGSLAFPLTFDPPEHGDRVWSVGYTNFRFPEGGVPVEKIITGEFDWLNEYSHELRVVVGHVDRIFIQKFASGFITGPCFTFTAEVPSGLSGGSIISSKGFITGINSATASSFFDCPMSIGSLLYPMLFTTLRFGASLGPLRINSQRSVLELIVQGVLSTDGSEEHLGITQTDDGKPYAAGPRMPISMKDYVHDDFHGFQKKKMATLETKPVSSFRRKSNDEPS